MRSMVRLVACALLAVFIGTPAWASACDISCEAASRQHQAQAQPLAGPAAPAPAHHHGDHHAAPAAEAATSQAAPAAHLAPIADECESAGLIVTASATPSTRTWDAQLAPVPLTTFAAALRHDAGVLRPVNDLASPRPDRPLAAILRI